MKHETNIFFTFRYHHTSCSLFEGPKGKTSLLDTSDEPAGQNCQYGGIKISTGIDSNDNGILDSNEITSTKYVCNGPRGNVGSAGVNSLISTQEIPPGAMCPNGGLQVNSGWDLNNNGILDNPEIVVTKYICNGKDGLSDKQIRFRLPIVYTQGPETISGFYEENIFKFNIDYYPGVDSVIYQAGIRVSEPGSGCIVDLMNITDNQPIQNTQFVEENTGSYDPNYRFQQSPNIVKHFPHKEITLGVRIKGTSSGFQVVAEGFLYLYRK